jgi:hypothetical protein
MGRPKGAAHGFIIFWGPRQRLLSRPFYIKPGHEGGSAEKTLFGLNTAAVGRIEHNDLLRRKGL